MNRRKRNVVLCEQNLSVPQDTRVWREAVALSDAGYRVSVICPRTSGGPRREVLDGVEIFRYPSPPEMPGIIGQVVETAVALVCVSIVTMAIRLRGTIDVVHAANPPDTFFLVGRLAKVFGAKFVYDQHDLVPELLTARGGGGSGALAKAFGWLERRSYATADMVITPNNSYRRVAIERSTLRASANRIVTVRSGPDEIDSRPRTAPTVPTIAFAGVMGRQDGVSVLIEATALLRKQTDKQFKVILIGRGSEVEPLRIRSRELQINDILTWSGWVNQHELQRLLREATIAVSPDEDNPFTRRSTMTKIAEYLSLGVPSVIAELPENRATAGEASLYFEPGNAGDLAKRMLELINDEDLQADLAARSLERASELTWNHSRIRLLGAYDQLLNDAEPVQGDQLIDPRGEN
jgi:glycosyltransferase involved in cell wall biosynthesis